MPFSSPAYTAPTFSIVSRLPNLVVDELVKELEADYGHTLQPAAVTESRNFNLTHRKTSINWIDCQHWVAAVMESWIRDVNATYFNYDITYWTDSLQYTVYDGPGSHYRWHTDDSFATVLEGQRRKLSISLLLSDPDEYEGGELQFHNLISLQTHKPKKGDAIIFPSYCAHRVRPIRSGVRRSLVGWFGGPQWK